MDENNLWSKEERPLMEELHSIPTFEERQNWLRSHLKDFPPGFGKDFLILRYFDENERWLYHHHYPPTSSEEDIRHMTSIADALRSEQNEQEFRDSLGTLLRPILERTGNYVEGWIKKKVGIKSDQPPVVQSQDYPFSPEEPTPPQTKKPCNYFGDDQE